jgi:hypothetical protein
MCLRHLRGSQDEDAVTAVFVITVGPSDASVTQSLAQGSVQAITHRDTMRITPALIPEPLDVHDEDGPVDSQALILHLTSGNKPEAIACLQASLSRRSAAYTVRIQSG